MPRRCCVPMCKSNYDSALKGNRQCVTTFRFPQDPARRTQWIRAIPRKDWTPSASAAVCCKHFPERDILRSESFPDSSGSLCEMPLRYPKLKENAVPSIFPNLREHLTKQKLPERKNPEERLERSLQQRIIMGKRRFRGRCCVPGCQDVTSHRHSFPNPRKHMERYKKWVRVVGNSTLATLDPQIVHKNKRVCRNHFETVYFSFGSKRLHLNAVPTLHLPDSSNEKNMNVPDEIKQEPNIKQEYIKCEFCNLKIESNNPEGHVCITSIDTEILIKEEKTEYWLLSLTDAKVEEFEIDLFKCEECDFTCKDKGGLETHKNVIHLNSIEAKWFNCEKCDFRCKTSGGLKSHNILLHLKKVIVK